MIPQSLELVTIIVIPITYLTFQQLNFFRSCIYLVQISFKIFIVYIFNFLYMLPQVGVSKQCSLPPIISMYGSHSIDFEHIRHRSSI